MLGKPVSMVAKRVAIHIRLPLIAPEELKEVEEENEKDNLLHVIVFIVYCLAVRVCVHTDMQGSESITLIFSMFTMHVTYT